MSEVEQSLRLILVWGRRMSSCVCGVGNKQE
jgi:hypothetical protein